jgi:hypothetical protein
MNPMNRCKTPTNLLLFSALCAAGLAGLFSVAAHAQEDIPRPQTQNESLLGGRTFPTMKKVFIKTFGCQMNEYDSDKMADVMHAAEGYEPTHDPEQADLILFNTCSVREKAQEKVFSDLGRVKHLKSKGVLIGVGGCVASQEGAAIIERAPYVDVVFGPQTLHRLPELLAERERQHRPQVDISFPRSRSSTTCRRRGSTAPPPSSRSWKAAPSTAATAWCPTPAARKCRARSTTCWPKWPAGRPGRARSHAAGPERQRLPRPMGDTARSPTSRC